MSDIQYIQDTASLKTLCQQLAGSEWLTLDTEFLREKTYYPQLCLIQIANHDLIACIDPLAIDDLTPLYALLHDESIVKVLHAAVQDQEILYQSSQQPPKPVFDTQVAASLLGYGDQMGYAKLVEKICGVQLDKSQSRTDWSRRPLNEKQIDYAADDVRHLREIYQHLKTELERLGRSDWLQKDFDDLANPQRYDPDPDSAYKRVKQYRRLRPKQLVILKALAEWREKRAMDKNKPRKWIASDDLLMDLCKIQPKTVAEIGQLRSASEGFVQHQGQYILDLMQSAQQTPQEQWPVLPSYQALTPNQEAQVDYLMAAAKLIADDNNITTGSLVSRKQLEQLVQGNRDIPLMKSWRYTVLGQSLVNLLEGHANLNIQQHTLRYRDAQ
ncbi:ribonuclease D [gamma proteobacterium HTCC5015]|nr:ribonuclease D [gamma proteobacterium HTCC5015]